MFGRTCMTGFPGLVRFAYALGAWVGVASAQSLDPVPVWPSAGGPQPGAVYVAEPRPARPAFPDLPPLAEIEPAMPYPEASPRMGPPADAVLLHDAETGETVRLPLRLRSGKLGDSSADPGYSGIGGVDAADGDAAGLFSFGPMTPAGNLHTFPRSGNVRLLMRFRTSGGASRWRTCSGSMADAGVVQTAAHCVYSRDPDVMSWAAEIFVYAGWDGVDDNFDGLEEHFGVARGTSFLAGDGYVTDGNYDRDAGLIRIRRDSRPGLGLLTGWFGWSWGGSCSTKLARSYRNFSYPSESCGEGGLHTGRTMYYWIGTFDSCVGNRLRMNTGSGCFDAAWGGMSGSGAYWIVGETDRRVLAVASNSDRATYADYTVFWEQWINDRIDFVDDTRGSVFDLVAMRARVPGGSNIVEAGDSLSGLFYVFVANPTNAAAAARNYTLRVYLSAGSDFSSTATTTLLATWAHNGLAWEPMATRLFGQPGPTIPANTPAGTYWLGAVLDPGTDAYPANNHTSHWDAFKIIVTNDRIFVDGFE